MKLEEKVSMCNFAQRQMISRYVAKDELRSAANKEVMRSASDSSNEWNVLASPDLILAILDELDAAENFASELNDTLCMLLPGCQYMDQPDGGDVPAIEQVVRMVTDYRDRLTVAEKLLSEPLESK